MDEWLHLDAHTVSDLCEINTILLLWWGVGVFICVVVVVLSLFPHIIIICFIFIAPFKNPRSLYKVIQATGKHNTPNSQREQSYKQVLTTRNYS